MQSDSFWVIPVTVHMERVKPNRFNTRWGGEKVYDELLFVTEHISNKVKDPCSSPFFTADKDLLT